MSGPKNIPPQEAAIILRGQRLRTTVNSEGWPDVLKIWDACVDDALDKVDKYTGTDEKVLAMLTASWKTAKTLRANFKATLESQIRESDQVANEFRKQPQPHPGAPEALHESATVVRPLCDIEEEFGAVEQEADAH